MVMMVPKARKHLSADALLGLLQTDFADIADRCSGKPDISLTDALVSALALFSLEPPSLLAFDKERIEGNLQRVYGIERVPCDTMMREILDPVKPESLRPLFKHVFGALQHPHLSPPDVGRCPHPSRPVRSDAPDARAHCEARWHPEKRL